MTPRLLSLLASTAILGLAGIGPAGAQPATPPAASVPDDNPPSRWQAPPPSSLLAGLAPPGELVSTLIAGIGLVQATRQTMAGIGKPVQGVPGPNRTVEACRQAAWIEGAKIGARYAEAASAGPQKTDRQGRTTAPVLIRMTYANAMGYQVREAIMTCTVDRAGRLLDAGM